MGDFLVKDRIKDFESLSKQSDVVIMYNLIVDKKTRIPISIDTNLHVTLSYCGFHVPLPDWFRSVHNCRLSRRSMLENFPSYMRAKGEEMNPILQEMNKLQHYKTKG